MRSAGPRSRCRTRAATSSARASQEKGRSTSAVRPCPCSSTATTRRPVASRPRTSPNASTTPKPPCTATSGVPPCPRLRQYICTPPVTGASPSSTRRSVVVMLGTTAPGPGSHRRWWDGAPSARRGCRLREVCVQYAENVIELVGHTPLVRLTSVTRDLGPDAPLVLAKVEYLNPGGSVKDRIAVRMVDEAEASGALQPGGTIVEPTSGNTGIGLALVAQQRGYRCVFVCPDKVGKEKIDVLKAYGAEVHVCPTAVDPADPRSYYSVSDRLAREIPGPEIWEQTDGRVTCFVTGVGTGGTISGTGRYLKEVSGVGVSVVGVDPEGSVYSGGTGRPYLVEGVGEDFWPDAYDRSIADEIVAVSDGDSFAMTRRLAREEGLLVGGSCGMAVAGALRAAERLTEDDVLVVLLPDGGRGYLGKIYNDDWMADYGFLEQATQGTVGELLAGKGGTTPELVHTHPNETVRDAIDILREYGVSQLPVVRAEPPVTAGEVVGSVDEKVLLDALFAGRASLADRVERHMSAPLPIIGSGEPVGAAVTALGEADALVVHVDGKPAGVVTRQDVLGHLAGVTPTVA